MSNRPLRALLLALLLAPAAAIAGDPAPAAEPAAAAGTEEPALVGSLTKEQVETTMRQNLGRVRGCYSRLLRADPKAAGTVTVRLSVAGDGKVSEAAIASSTLADEALQTCVADKVRTFRFPKAKDGGSTQVTYPFVFAPG